MYTLVRTHYREGSSMVSLWATCAVTVRGMFFTLSTQHLLLVQVRLVHL